MTYPKGVTRITYSKACECEAATASTGRLKLHTHQDDAIPVGERHIRFTVVMTDLCCDKCETPWEPLVQVTRGQERRVREDEAIALSRWEGHKDAGQMRQGGDRRAAGRNHG